jgi:hypothetical protein
MSEEKGVDWTGVSEKMARQILEQGEKFMAAQLQAALAADSRATSMAGMFVTLALAAIAGGVAWGDGAHGWAYLLGGFVTGGLLLWAAYRAAWAARPIDFYFPGNQPAQWWPNRQSNLVRMLGGEAENYEGRIKYNQEQLERNQGAIKDAFALAIVAPAIGAAVWLTAFLLSPA